MTRRACQLIQSYMIHVMVISVGRACASGIECNLDLAGLKKFSEEYQ